MADQAFGSQVYIGHKGVHAVDVPFDPRDVWPDLSPETVARKEDPRGGQGWPVTGTVNGVPFEGHVGLRYGRNYLILPLDVRVAADIVEGDVVEVHLTPRAR
jgi:hypothetical protein